MSFEYILILAVAVASISFKPGPGMAAIVARAMEFGFLSAFLVSMGAILVELVYFIIAYFGFSFIENYISDISIGLKIIGIIYLLYLAYSAFNKAKVIPTANNMVSNKRNCYKDFMVGVTVTLANPLVILFYTALIPTVLDLSNINITGLATALAIIFSVHFVILTAQCVLATQVKQLLNDRLTVQKFNLMSAGLLLAVAIYISYSLLITLMT